MLLIVHKWNTTVNICSRVIRLKFIILKYEYNILNEHCFYIRDKDLSQLKATKLPDKKNNQRKWKRVKIIYEVK